MPRMLFPADRTLRGYAWVGGGVAIISADSLLIRLSRVSGFDVAFARGVGVLFFMLVTLAMFPVAVPRGRERALLLFAGLGMGVSNMLFPLAVTMTSVANVLVIISATPLLAAILGWILLRERPSSRTMAAIICAMIGVAVVVHGSIGAGALTGDLLACAAALCISVNLVLLRGAPDVSRRQVMVVSGSVTALLSLLQAHPLALPAESLPWLLLLGLLVMPVSLLMITTGTRYLPAAEVALLLLLETLLGPFLVWLVLGEVPPVATFVGGGIIVVSLILSCTAALIHRIPATRANPQA